MSSDSHDAHGRPPPPPPPPPTLVPHTQAHGRHGLHAHRQHSSCAAMDLLCSAAEAEEESLRLAAVGGKVASEAPAATAGTLQARRDGASGTDISINQQRSTAATTSNIATSRSSSSSSSSSNSSSINNDVYSGGGGSGGCARATRQQQQALEVVFRENPVPNGVMHHAIAARLGMTRKAVRNWNSRAKVRRLAQQGDADATAMLRAINELQRQRISEPYSLDWQRQQEQSSLFAEQSDLVLVRPPAASAPRAQLPPLQSIKSPPIMQAEAAKIQKPYVMSVEALI
ncbi:hypothetical protein HDU82_001921 [Entophlyctis luteolus]|nr:hypothetical protein HDU82_001921 [Entophlyctis luteolus]